MCIQDLEEPWSRLRAGHLPRESVDCQLMRRNTGRRMSEADPGVLIDKTFFLILRLGVSKFAVNNALSQVFVEQDDWTCGPIPKFFFGAQRRSLSRCLELCPLACLPEAVFHVHLDIVHGRSDSMPQQHQCQRLRPFLGHHLSMLSMKLPCPTLTLLQTRPQPPSSNSLLRTWCLPMFDLRQ